MHKLLIVDDEPFTVDGLFEMLLELSDLELDIYRAYSAQEAINWMSRTKMDIILSDIRMPEMDGLELQQWIQAQWPRCKVIFLTGINDIQFAQKAQRNGGTDYILKTEGDEAIVRSVKKAIDSLQEEIYNEETLIRAKGQLRGMLPILRREWFLTLLEQSNLTEQELAHRLSELDTSLRSDENILLVCGRADYWNEEMSISDQMLLLYAIQNIGEEYMERVVMLPVMLGGSYFVWLIQPKIDDTSNWDHNVFYVQGTLESIQETCKALLKVSVSFICHQKAVGWKGIAAPFNELRQNLILGLGNGQEMILIHREEASSEPVEFSGQILSRIENAIEMGQEKIFQNLLSELFERIPNRFSIYAQIYYAVAVILLNQWNKIQWSIKESDRHTDARISKLLDVNAHHSKEQAVQFLRDMSQYVFQSAKREQNDRTDRIIHKLNRYIEDNLNADLSLTVLADAVYLNPSYLSNLYKTYTGRNISEYITELRVERAKSMLANSQAKVQEIGMAIGFDAAGYFTRFFKKHVGVTPQEFRSRLN